MLESLCADSLEWSIHCEKSGLWNGKFINLGAVTDASRNCLDLSVCDTTNGTQRCDKASTACWNEHVT